MHGAARPDEAGPEEFEQAIHLQKDPPETARIFRIKSCMSSILAKTNWVRHLVGHSPIFTFIRRSRRACSSLSWFHAPTKTGYSFSRVTQGPHVSRDRLEMFV
jgi:hypothetical protein